ncbi:MAG: methyltransferase domain-containing protein [Pseudomonadota bacterium]
METYDAKAAELIERSYQTPEIVHQRNRTLAALALRRGEAVLDAGCGTGLLLEMEAKAVDRSGRAEGLDLSDDMLAVARTRCAPFPQVNLQQGSVETLPFDDAAFDALSCTQTLLYVSDMVRALKDFHRVLKPGGRLAVIETDWSGAIINASDQALTRRIFDAWDSAVSNANIPRYLTAKLRSSGFSNISVEAIPVLNASYSSQSFSANMLKNFTATAVRHDVITQAESDAWYQEQMDLIERDEYFFCVNRFLFRAIK